MARARNIKPSIMDNEDLADIEPLTRLLFIYLWMLADREGRLEDRPKRIAAQALAYDRNADVSKMLDKLQTSGFIERYEANGVACIQIKSFAKHQTPHIREAASTLPSIEQGTTKAVPKHNLGNAEASPRSPESGFLIPDTPYLIPDCEDTHTIPKDLLADFLVVRKAKKAGALTKTAIKGIQREADKAGLTLIEAVTVCCELGWQGFNAGWYAERQAKGKPAESFKERDDRNARKRWEEMTGQVHPDNMQNIFARSVNTDNLLLEVSP